MTEYTGSAYIGVVGGDHEIPECRDSIHLITARPGDSHVVFQRGTKGYENREMHIQKFLASTHDFILLLDHDQTFPQDTLERLRSHKLPFVSGYYMRRHINPIAPVWFEPFNGNWPMIPWTADPERGKLHPLGASGWGCILIHRAVFEAVAPLLKGEQFVLEDDMDVWPYDLMRINQALNGIENIALGINSILSLLEWTHMLRDEIRPLRVIKSQIGSDIRFPFFAAQAGFQLMGDPDVRCGHGLTYFVGPDDYTTNYTDDYRERLVGYLNQSVDEERAEIKRAREAME
jgi:hypothetical protein